MPFLTNVLKLILPPRVSYRLRVAKALLIDRDLQALKVVAKAVGTLDTVAIDVGANAGIYAAILARYFGQVICIEPNPTCASYLKAVLPSRCVLVERAVSDEEGFAELTVPIFNKVLETTRGTISSTNVLEGSEAEVQRIKVGVTTLDHILASPPFKVKGRISFLKVDVEGHELQVLKGAKALLSKHKPVVMTELEGRHGTPVEEVIGYFYSHAYTASSLNSKDLSFTEFENIAGISEYDVNFLFRPV